MIKFTYKGETYTIKCGFTFTKRETVHFGYHTDFYFGALSQNIIAWDV